MAVGCGAFAMKVARMVQKTKLKKKVARFDPFTRGMVWGMHLAKVPREEIQRQVFKKDGSMTEFVTCCTSCWSLYVVVPVRHVVLVCKCLSCR